MLMKWQEKSYGSGICRMQETPLSWLNFATHQNRELSALSQTTWLMRSGLTSPFLWTPLYPLSAFQASSCGLSAYATNPQLILTILTLWHRDGSRPKYLRGLAPPLIYETVFPYLGRASRPFPGSCSHFSVAGWMPRHSIHQTQCQDHHQGSTDDDSGQNRPDASQGWETDCCHQTRANTV